MRRISDLHTLETSDIEGIPVEPWMLSLIAANPEGAGTWTWGFDTPGCLRLDTSGYLRRRSDPEKDTEDRHPQLFYFFLQVEGTAVTAHLALCFLDRRCVTTSVWVVSDLDRQGADTLLSFVWSDWRALRETAPACKILCPPRITEVREGWRTVLAVNHGSFPDPYQLHTLWKDLVSEEDLSFVVDRVYAEMASERCVDKLRVAYLWDSFAVSEFKNIEHQGCCGSQNLLIVPPSLRPYLVGFNYGH